MTDDTDMELEIQPLEKKDAGRNLAALPEHVMEELGVTNGDHVKLQDPNNDSSNAYCRVWPGYAQDDPDPNDPNDNGDNIVRIDGRVRRRLSLGIGDTVTVRGVNVQPAASIEIATPEFVQLRGAEKLFKDHLDEYPIEEGETKRIQIGMMGPMGQQRGIPIRVTNTEPDGVVRVVESTEVFISDKPLEQFVDAGAGDTPDVAYEDIGGLDKELRKVREMIELPMRHSELFAHLGIEPPKGVLLHGPPGTGKTMMAQAVANEVDAEFYSISGPEIMSRFYGESEEQLRETFDEASQNSPAIIFIDEIDSIAPSRDDTGGDVERRIVAQLLSLMDGLEERGDVIVIGATNRVDAVDNALRRGGRFDRELEIGVPNEEGRKEILQIHTRGMPLTDDVDLDEYAEKTYGFVGADIQTLTKEAAMAALRRVKPELDLETDEIDAEVLRGIKVTRDDFKKAMQSVEPSAMREVFVETPSVEWDHIGGLNETKDSLREMVEWPLDYPDVFKDMDVEAANGVLLYGPPGTGKTMLAKAIANESDSNFISVKGPELLNKWVGESEKGLREIFSKARENAPAVVFFDEIDAIATERGASSGTSGVGERMVSQLLTELDGLEALEDVVVIATSNRPDLIDSALLRPGRFDRHIHVPVPGQEARRRIFEVHTENKNLADDVDLDWLADNTEQFVGADIEALCREAAMKATREVIQDLQSGDSDDTTKQVTMAHFKDALDEVSPSVDDEVKEKYDELEEQMEATDPVDDSPDVSAFH